MILENGVSRVYLGVHWVFDAFALKAKQPDITKKVGGKHIGGVPLGLLIAEDVFKAGNGLGPKKSNVGPRIAAEAVTERAATFRANYLPATPAR